MPAFQEITSTVEDRRVQEPHPDPRRPTLIKTIDAQSLSAKAGYSQPHTLHCGPDGVFLTSYCYR
jgi:hypothetical protein